MDQMIYLVALVSEDLIGGETLGVCATLEEANRLKALLDPQEVEIRPLRVISPALLDKWEEKKREANRLAHEAWLEKVRREKENVPLPPPLPAIAGTSSGGCRRAGAGPVSGLSSAA